MLRSSSSASARRKSSFVSMSMARSHCMTQPVRSGVWKVRWVRSTLAIDHQMAPGGQKGAKRSWLRCFKRSGKSVIDCYGKAALFFTLELARRAHRLLSTVDFYACSNCPHRIGEGSLKLASRDLRNRCHRGGPGALRALLFRSVQVTNSCRRTVDMSL